MKNLLKIILFFGVVFGICAEGPLPRGPIPLPGLKSITIDHIGEQDAPMDILIINNHKNGLITDYFGRFIYYISVQESFFDEIINLINENRELFDENDWGSEYGCYQLFIENEDKGEKYFLFLNRREKSIIFFKKLYEMVIIKNNYDALKRRLEVLINITMGNNLMDYGRSTNLSDIYIDGVQKNTIQNFLNNFP